MTEEVENIYQNGHQYFYHQPISDPLRTTSVATNSYTDSLTLDSLSEFFVTNQTNATDSSQLTDLSKESSDTFLPLHNQELPSYRLHDPNQVSGTETVAPADSTSCEQRCEPVLADALTAADGDDILSKATRSIMDPTGLSEDYYPGPKRMRSQSHAGR